MTERWTLQEDGFLRSYYKGRNWSARRIGAVLGRTRREVIGRAYRLGLSASPSSETRTAEMRELLARYPGISASKLGALMGIPRTHALGMRWRIRNPEKQRSQRRRWYARQADRPNA